MQANSPISLSAFSQGRQALRKFRRVTVRD